MAGCAQPRAQPSADRMAAGAPSRKTLMNMTIALALTVVGIVLLIVGLGSADSIQNSFSRLFTGHLTDRTMWLVVGGSVCVIAGLVGCHRSRRV